MPIVIEIAGSSTVISGSATGFSGSASVSPIMMSGMPAIATMSPGPASQAGLALEALGDEQLGDLDVLDRAVALHPRDLLALLQGALLDPDQREPAEERARSRGW